MCDRQVGGEPSLIKIKRAVQLFGCRDVEVHVLDVKVADVAAIYQAEYRVLSALPGHAAYYYNLTSGTGAMHSVQLLMSVKFPGFPIYTVRPDFRSPGEPGARIVPLPDILSGIAPDASPSEGPFIAGVNRKIFEQVRNKIARTRASVLIVGDTGAGKTQLARYIHACSDRAGKEMISVNCAEVAGDHNMMRSELFGHKKNSFTGAVEEKKGAFEKASGSTLFLDEVGEIPLNLQSLLLKALDEGLITPLGSNRSKKVDVRIIAATNRDLLKDVKEGRFRCDLYYRLAQYMPRLSPVSAYSENDRSRLLDYLLDSINKEWCMALPRVLSLEARALLLAYAWPGNIREMKFRLTTICLLSDTVITADDASGQLELQQEPEAGEDFIPSDINAWLDEKHAMFIRRALRLSGGSDAKAARMLSLPQSTFISRKKKFGL
ncbi:sigma 54-interacting transcriptional regulator [Mailhella massiliensis]|uniref:Sigma 54-interacting transcriptional regulator n=1 Tax=Mailhella massiliensis TaxID=1903261 RepID=A0A921AYC3_9BACT|nr:sigma 54-interacting transcriptional regulator [Mailhella massiliensis]HJD98107.1 sigma 54-interacting transcriptional regulator [Mailhella massiliensis]